MNIDHLPSRLGKQAHFIIFKTHKLIYARVPKVANSSVKTALTAFVTVNNTEGLKPTNDKFWNNCTNGETRIVDRQQATQLKNDFFSFSFVREPLDRLVSCYVNKLVVNASLSDAFIRQGYRKSMSFDEFVVRSCEIPEESMDVHVRPQASMVLFDDGSLPDFVGKYETLDLHWATLSGELKKRGLKELGPLPKINSKQAHRQKVDCSLSESTRAMFLQKYHRDYELFYPHLT